MSILYTLISQEQKKLIESGIERRNSKGERYMLLDPMASIRFGLWMSRSEVPAEGRYFSSAMKSIYSPHNRVDSPYTVIAESSNEMATGVEIGDVKSESDNVIDTPKCTLGTNIDPNWLIGKRIKVWWPGNLSFFDADVKGILFIFMYLYITLSFYLKCNMF